GETPGEILGNSLNAAPFNFAKRTRRGIDVDLSYRSNIGSDARISTRVLYTHQLQNSNYQSATDPNFENRLLGELGDPVDRVNFDIDLQTGPVTFGYQMRYIGPMWLNAYEDFNALQDRGPQDADYADTQEYPAVFYHDVRVDFRIGPPKAGLLFFVGVDNVLDTMPPLGSTATGTGSAIYQIRGRNFYSGFRARF
ncbi:MAG: TonB-dependent receptor, partial [Sphingomonas sp.]